MLVIALLVIPVGFNSFIWFFGFSFLFYLLSFQYTLAVIKWLFQKIINISKPRKASGWKNLTIENISYDKSLGLIKLNSKTLNFDQIVSVDIIANSKKVKASELSKISDVKKLEIKIGTQVKKVIYRHFKYITGNILSKLSFVVLIAFNLISSTSFSLIFILYLPLIVLGSGNDIISKFVS